MERRFRSGQTIIGLNHQKILQREYLMTADLKFYTVIILKILKKFNLHEHGLI
jgi:hypothetical protein